MLLRPSKRRGGELAIPYPRLHIFLEHVERQLPAAEDLVVEGADVELRAELLLRVAAELADLQLADLVARDGAGLHDVAVDLVFDLAVRLRGVRAAEVDGLLARPAFRVQAGVDHEADGAPTLVIESDELRVGVHVQTELVAAAL